MPSRRMGWGPMLPCTHFLGITKVRGCVPAISSLCRLHAIESSLRQSPQAVRLQVHANWSLFVDSLLILEVASSGYNLYLTPHESTALPHATGADPVAIRDCPCASTDAVVEWNRQQRGAVRHGSVGVG